MSARVLIAVLSGLLVGLVSALACVSGLGVDVFALGAGRVALGYGAAALVAGTGAALAGARRDSWASGVPLVRRALAGAALGAVTAYALRGLGLPWVNLHALDAGGGPVGELPILVLPLLGAMAGGLFAASPPR
jgi:hypothetical protein